MSRRDTIWKWVFYTAGVLLLLLLQGLALDHISLLHVHPYLPPVMVAVLAMFEGAYGGMGVALAMGLLFDLTQPGLIPCFHIWHFCWRRWPPLPWPTTSLRRGFYAPCSWGWRRWSSPMGCKFC